MDQNKILFVLHDYVYSSFSSDWTEEDKESSRKIV